MGTHSDEDPITRKIKLYVDILNRVGFPIIVCVWLAYQQFVIGANTNKALSDFREVLMSLKTSIDTQNKIMRHKNRSTVDE